MGLFDRYRRPAARRYEFADRPIADRPIIVDQNGKASYGQRGNPDSVLWLLLIPLLLLLGLGVYSYLGNPSLNNMRSNSRNFLSRLFNNSRVVSPSPVGTTASNKSNGLQFGVGGAAPTATPTQSGTSTVISPTPTSSQTGSVQERADRSIPQIAPATGRGGE